MIVITHAPPYLTVQDGGRKHSRSSGVPQSGAMDGFALCATNAMVGNSLAAAAFEWALGGGTLRFESECVFAIGGATDHVHALLSLPSMMSFAKAVQLIKGGSSKWVHEALPQYRKCEWQEGYGAFSVSASRVPKAIAYINNQKEHHRRKAFHEEFLELLKKHGIEYDSRYVF